eukprot:10066-Heterocapsa_arctica.AAC.1
MALHERAVVMKEQCGGRHDTGQRVAEAVVSAGQRVLSAGRAEAAGSTSELPTSHGRSLERRLSPGAMTSLTNALLLLSMNSTT